MPPVGVENCHRVNRDRTTWATCGLLGGCALGVAYLFANLLLFAYGRDQGIYSVVADAILDGRMPYRDAWDFKPPGIYVVYALARSLFGSSQSAIRVLEVIGLGSLVWAFVILARRFFGDGRIGVVGGALAVLAHAQLEFWHTAQPESFGGILVVWAIVAATFRPCGISRAAGVRQILAWLAAGAMYGAAGLLKPPLAGGLVVSALLVGLETRSAVQPRRDPPRSIRHLARLVPRLIPACAMTVGCVGVLAGCILWFALRGALHDLYDALFVFAPHYTKLAWQNASILNMSYASLEAWLVDLSSANFVGIVAALALPPLFPQERRFLRHILGIVGVQLLGVALQAKFFPYHYGASLLLGGFVAGLGAYKLWVRSVGRGVLHVAAYAILAILAMNTRTPQRDLDLTFRERCRLRSQYLLHGRSPSRLNVLNDRLYSVADVSYGADRQVAEYLGARLATDETFYIWGFEPIIYEMARRRPASRYIYNVPQRVAWSRDQARAELMADLRSRPPAAIVVAQHDVFPMVTGDLTDSAVALQGFAELVGLLNDRYELVTTVEDLQVYMSTTESDFPSRLPREARTAR